MKPLSYTQKKWAMATFLVGALTISASLHTPAKVSQLDLASTDDQVEGKLATGDGVVDVKYIKNGEQVMAVLPAVAEGKICDACGKSYNLSVAFDKNKGDINALNDALLKHLKNNKNKTDSIEVENKVAAKKKQKPKKDEGPQELTAFTRAFESCEADEHAAKADCMVNEYVETIKNKKVSASLALEVFTAEIEPKLAVILKATGAWDKDPKGFETSIDKVLLMLDKIKSDLPEDKNNVRLRLMAIEKEVIGVRSMALKEKLELLKTNLNNNSVRNQITFDRYILGKFISSVDSMNDPSSARTTHMNIAGYSLESLKNALENGTIKPEQASQFYTEQYKKTVQAMLEGLNASYKDLGPQSIVNPAAIILEGHGLSSGTIQNGSPRTNVPNPGTTTRSTLPAGVLNNQTNNNVGPYPGTIVSPNTQVPQQGRTFQGRGF